MRLFSSFSKDYYLNNNQSITMEVEITPRPRDISEVTEILSMDDGLFVMEPRCTHWGTGDNGTFVKGGKVVWDEESQTGSIDLVVYVVIYTDVIPHYTGQTKTHDFLCNATPNWAEESGKLVTCSIYRTVDEGQHYLNLDLPEAFAHCSFDKWNHVRQYQAKICQGLKPLWKCNNSFGYIDPTKYTSDNERSMLRSLFL